MKQAESLELKIYREKLKVAVTGHYTDIVKITGQPKSTISDVLNGKIWNTATAKTILKAAVQVRDDLKKKEEALAKLIS